MAGKAVLAGILILSLCMLLGACSPGIDAMTDNFNSSFRPSSSSSGGPSSSLNEYEPEPSIFDEAFSPAAMLTGPYTLRSYSTLCLLAPGGGERYQWTVDAVAGAGAEKTAGSCLLGEDQQLNLYVPGTALTVWTEYTLTLTVYASDGSIYTDTATLWIVPA